MSMPASLLTRVEAISRPTLVVGTAVTLIVLMRQPYAIFRPQFVFEEAAAFWAPTFTRGPLEYLLTPWAGYFQLLPRVAFLVARLGPAVEAPALTILLHAILIGSVAAAMVSRRFESLYPGRAVQMAFGLSLALLPVAEPYVSVLSAQWFLAILLCALALAPARTVDYPVILVAGLSGLGAFVTLPLFGLSRRGMLLASTAAIQAIPLLTSSRRPEPAPAWLLFVLSGMLIVALLLAPDVPVRFRAGLGLVATATIALGTIAGAPLSGRYLLGGWAAVSLASISSAAARRPGGIALAGFSVFAVLMGASIPAVPDTRWAANASCIGSSQTCLVPVDPVAWSVSWPGDPARYVAPVSFDQGQPVYPAAQP